MTPIRLLLMLCALWLAAPAFAHKASDAYLLLRSDDAGSSLRVDVALRDLDVALDIDENADGRITWGEVRAAWPVIDAFVARGVSVEGCAMTTAGRGLERRSDGVYAALTLSSDCRPAGAPVVRYTLLRDVDATHRGLLKIEGRGGDAVLQVLDPSNPAPAATAAAEPSAASTSFVAEGVRHILGGYDHVLFLLCLLLPAVMRREYSRWRPVTELAQALWPVVGIVTSFTLAHSITLALASLKWVSLPPAIVEPAIAATIVLAAIDNLRPIFRGRRAVVTFVFGLIHGFGFAGVLGEMNLGSAQFAWVLLQFNLGLELGQLLLVVLALGALFLLRESPRYPAWAIRGGSAVCIVLGAAWFVERTAGWQLLPT